MKYSVYQIQLTDAEIDQINDKGHDAVPAQVAKLKMIMDFSGDRIGQTAYEAFDAGYYTHVANIEADCVNDVYTIGNIGPQKSIQRLSPMSSVSVGDIIVNEEGQMTVVAPVGFVNFSFRPDLVA
jgi:hypothetical protein